MSLSNRLLKNLATLKFLVLTAFLLMGCLPNGQAANNNSPNNGLTNEDRVTPFEKGLHGLADIEGIWPSIMGGYKWMLLNNDVYFTEVEFNRTISSLFLTPYTIWTDIVGKDEINKNLKLFIDSGNLNFALIIKSGLRLYDLEDFLINLDKHINQDNVSYVWTSGDFFLQEDVTKRMIVGVHRNLKRLYVDTISSSTFINNIYFNSMREELIKISSELIKISRPSHTSLAQKENEILAHQKAQQWFRNQTGIEFNSINQGQATSLGYSRLYARLLNKALFMIEDNEKKSLSSTEVKRLYFENLLHRLDRAKKNYMKHFITNYSEGLVLSIWKETESNNQQRKLEKIHQGSFADLSHFLQILDDGSIGLNTNYQEHHLHLYLDYTNRYINIDLLSNAKEVKDFFAKIAINAVDSTQTQISFDLQTFHHINNSTTVFEATVSSQHKMMKVLNQRLIDYSEELREYLLKSLGLPNKYSQLISEKDLPLVIENLSRESFQIDSFAYYFLDEFGIEPEYRFNRNYTIREFKTIIRRSLLSLPSIRHNNFLNLKFHPIGAAKMVLLNGGYFRHQLDPKTTNNPKMIRLDKLFQGGESVNAELILNQLQKDSPSRSTGAQLGTLNSQDLIQDLFIYLGAKDDLDVTYEEKAKYLYDIFKKNKKIIFSINKDSSESRFFIFSDETQISSDDHVVLNIKEKIKKSDKLILKLEIPISPKKGILPIPSPIRHEFKFGQIITATGMVVKLNQYSVRQSSDGAYYFKIHDQSLLGNKFTYKVSFSKLPSKRIPLDISLNRLKALIPQLESIGLRILSEKISNFKYLSLSPEQVSQMISQSTIYSKKNETPFQPTSSIDNLFNDLVHLVSRSGHFVGVCKHSAILTDLILRKVLSDVSSSITFNYRTGISLNPNETAFRIDDEVHVKNEIIIHGERFYLDSTGVDPQKLPTTQKGGFLKILYKLFGQKDTNREQNQVQSEASFEENKNPETQKSSAETNKSVLISPPSRSPIDINSKEFMNYLDALVRLSQSQSQITKDRQLDLKKLQQRRHPITKIIGIATALKDYLSGKISDSYFQESLSFHLDEKYLNVANQSTHRLIRQKIEFALSQLISLNSKILKKQNSNFQKMFQISEQDLAALEGQKFSNELINLLSVTSRFSLDLLPEATKRYITTNPQSEISKALSLVHQKKLSPQKSEEEIHRLIQELNTGKNPNDYRRPNQKSCQILFQK